MLAAARGAGIVAIATPAATSAGPCSPTWPGSGPVSTDPDADRGTRPSPADSGPQLVPEQRALLERLAGGETIAAAAAAEFLSLRTANRRIAEARQALGVRTTREAVLAYLRQPAPRTVRRRRRPAVRENPTPRRSAAPGLTGGGATPVPAAGLRRPGRIDVPGQVRLVGPQRDESGGDRVDDGLGGPGGGPTPGRIDAGQVDRRAEMHPDHGTAQQGPPQRRQQPARPAYGRISCAPHCATGTTAVPLARASRAVPVLPRSGHIPGSSPIRPSG